MLSLQESAGIAADEPKRFKYRRDIDGLRAIAVIGVLLFHAGLGFRGGYVGVDVFFVISGFLITGIILKELKNNSFSFANFWVRRIKRILPAVSATVIAVVAAAWFVLDAKSYENLGKSSGAQSLMLANVFYWKDVGYFSEGADFKPLLHTWSLAVEEQFYLGFPILLVVLFRHARRWLVTIISFLALASLILSICTLAEYPTATFFLLPPRAWELLVGAITLLLKDNFRAPNWASELLSCLGLAMIVAAMLVFNPETPFPGFAATLPVLGAAFFILANDKNTISGSVVGNPVFVFIGLISYSLYLVHWPVFVMARHLYFGLSNDLFCRIALVVLSLLLATISWALVEQPFRNKSLMKSNLSSFSFGGITTATLLALSFSVIYFKGVPSRFDSKMRLLAEDVSWHGEEYEMSNGKGVAIGDSTKQNTDFALWGDSHGMCVAETLDETAKKSGMKGLAFLSAGRPPVTGLWKPEKGKSREVTTTSQNREIFEIIVSQKIKNVVLVARWSAMCEGRNDAELLDSPSTPSGFPMVASRDFPVPSRESSATALRQELDKMITAFEQEDIRVWIVLQVPEGDNCHIARQFYVAQRFPSFNSVNIESTPLKSHHERQAMANRVITSLTSENLIVVDPTPVFYPAGESKRLQVVSSRAHYRDDDHLSRFGAEKFMSALFRNLFNQMRDIESNE